MSYSGNQPNWNRDTAQQSGSSSMKGSEDVGISGQSGSFYESGGQRYGGSSDQGYGGSSGQRYEGSSNQGYGGSSGQRYGGSSDQGYGGSSNQGYGGLSGQRYEGSSDTGISNKAGQSGMGTNRDIDSDIGGSSRQDGSSGGYGDSRQRQ
ncbi:unnamed protein product [Rotaria sp. Silwood2]|nr:unnamed protein product [Rotaria sp. Silwood2]